jgi:hypothetical protein
MKLTGAKEEKTRRVFKLKYDHFETKAINKIKIDLLGSKNEK